MIDNMVLFSELVSRLIDEEFMIDKEKQILLSIKNTLLDINNGSSEWCRIYSGYMDFEKTSSFCSGQKAAYYDVLEKCELSKCDKYVIQHEIEELMKFEERGFE